MGQISNQENEIFRSYLDSLYVLSHSEGTVLGYFSGLKRFRNFLSKEYQLDIIQFVKQVKSDKLDVYDSLKKFVIHLDKDGMKYSTVKGFMAAAKGYLRHEGIKIYSEDFKMVVKMPRKIHYREEALTKEILVRLLHNVSSRLQVTILVALASGMRIGEIAQLKISDINFQSNPPRIRIRAETTKGKEARETFLTQEATTALKDYLSRVYDWVEGQTHFKDELIFGRTENSNNPRLTVVSLEKSLKVHTSKVPELSKTSENGRKTIHFHAFRKFFRTTVGNAVGRDFAEAIMGHHFYLDTYYNLPDEQRREMYIKAEPFLTISDFSKVEKDLVSVKLKQKELEENQLNLLLAIKRDHVEFPKMLEKLIK